MIIYTFLHVIGHLEEMAQEMLFHPQNFVETKIEKCAREFHFKRHKYWINIYVTTYLNLGLASCKVRA